MSSHLGFLSWTDSPRPPQCLGRLYGNPLAMVVVEPGSCCPLLNSGANSFSLSDADLSRHHHLICHLGFSVATAPGLCGCQLLLHGLRLRHLFPPHPCKTLWPQLPRGSLGTSASQELPPQPCHPHLAPLRRRTSVQLLPCLPHLLKSKSGGRLQLPNSATTRRAPPAPSQPAGVCLAATVPGTRTQGPAQEAGPSWYCQGAPGPGPQLAEQRVEPTAQVGSPKDPPEEQRQLGPQQVQPEPPPGSLPSTGS